MIAGSVSFRPREEEWVVVLKVKLKDFRKKAGDGVDPRATTIYWIGLIICVVGGLLISLL